jgi:ankyrin repeat protein
VPRDQQHDIESKSVDELIQAAERGDRATVERLLNQGADIDGCASWEGCDTALIRAINGKQLGMVELLLNRGANPNKTANVPLFAAAQSGNVRLVDLLVEHGGTLSSDPELLKRERETIRIVGGQEVYNRLFSEDGTPKARAR